MESRQFQELQPPRPRRAGLHGRVYVPLRPWRRKLRSLVATHHRADGRAVLQRAGGLAIERTADVQSASNSVTRRTPQHAARW